VLTTHEAGKLNAVIEDEEVLSYAVSQKRAIITHNRLHFKRLHKHAGAHSGIIICNEDRDFSALAQRIHNIVEQYNSLDNMLISVIKNG